MLDMVARFSFARILVVDDSTLAQNLITTALQRAGFKNIITANDGVEALKITHDFHPDCVLLDLFMPNMDGFGYCERVRNDPKLPRMPIIVQTESSKHETWGKARACGADDYLVKPIDMEDLTLRICAHVERYCMMKELQDMCSYLKMELEFSENLRKDSESLEPEPDFDMSQLKRHYEVLEQIIHSSTCH